MKKTKIKRMRKKMKRTFFYLKQKKNRDIYIKNLSLVLYPISFMIL